MATRTGLLGPERAPRPRPAHSLAEFCARLPPTCLPASLHTCPARDHVEKPSRPACGGAGDLGALLFSCQAPGHVGRGQKTSGDSGGRRGKIDEIGETVMGE